MFIYYLILNYTMEAQSSILKIRALSTAITFFKIAADHFCC